jgi:hypothetical protein
MKSIIKGHHFYGIIRTLKMNLINIDQLQLLTNVMLMAEYKDLKKQFKNLQRILFLLSN